MKELEILTPEERLSRVGAEGGAVSELLLAMAEETRALVLEDAARALEHGRLVDELAQRVGDDRVKVMTKMALAHAMSSTNRFNEAIDLLADAERIANDSGRTFDQARIRLNLLQPLARLGRIDEALEAAEEARERFVALGELVWAAKTDFNVGNIHRIRDDPRTALAHLDHARPHLLDEPMILAQLESNRADVLMDLNEFVQAERAFGSAIEAFERAGSRRAEAIVHGNLADMLARQGRLKEAVRHYELARRQFEHDAAAGDMARLDAERADALASIGATDEAVQAFERALPLLETSGLAFERARGTLGLGRALLQAGRVEQAERMLGEADRQFEKLGHRTGMGMTRVLRSTAHLARGDPVGAESLAVEAGTLLEDRPSESALAVRVRALAALERGDLEAAEKHLEAAFASAQRVGVAPLMAELHHLRARILRARGEGQACLSEFDRALVQVERLRGSFGADRLRNAVVGTRMRIYEDTIEASLDFGGDKAVRLAFDTVERARGRALLDATQGGVDLGEDLAAARPDSHEAALVQELASRRASLNALYAVLDAGLGTGGVGGGGGAVSLDEWRGQLRECEDRIAELEQRLAATRSAGAIFGSPIELPAAQGLLDEESALVEYFATGGRLMAFVVRREGAEVFRDLADLADVEELTAALMFQIRRALARSAGDPRRADRMEPDARRALGRLYEAILAPISGAIAGVHRLVFVPFGPLHAVPFHALHDGQEYLVERVRVRYAPSASVLRSLRTSAAEASSDRRGALIVGVPDEAAPGIEAEVRSISDALPGSALLMDPEATLASLRERCRGVELIHLACHGSFPAGRPMAAALRLSDGWMTVRDIFGLELGGSMVTLSGCETARAAVSGADEVYGLARGFLVSGAAGLVASLWSAHDLTTRELMSRAYGLWSELGARTPAALFDALTLAQRELLGQRPHPALWAPFCAIGDPT